MSAEAMILVGASGPFVGLALAYLVIRHFAAKEAQRLTASLLGPSDAPPCDQCGKDTGKPWLWRSTRSRWVCDPCEREATDQMFDGYRRSLEQHERLYRLRAGSVRPDEKPT